MGESAKRWTAGLGTAIAIILVVTAAIGRLGDRSVLGSSRSNVQVSLNKAHSVATGKDQSADSNQTAQTQPDPDAQTKAIRSTGSQHEKQKPTNKLNRTPRQPHDRSTLASARSVFSDAHLKTLLELPMRPLAPPTRPVPFIAVQPFVPRLEQLSLHAKIPGQPIDAYFPTGLMRTTDNVILNDILVKNPSPVFLNDRVVTPGLSGALITAKNNVITLGANTQLTVHQNSFALDSGGSNITTNSGMFTTVKDYIIIPANPNSMSRYEVSYASDGVYVFARTGDVEVKAPCRSWKLREGQVVKIRDPRRCPAAIFLTDSGTWHGPAFAAATGAGIAAVCAIACRPEPISAQHPRRSF